MPVTPALISLALLASPLGLSAGAVHATALPAALQAPSPPPAAESAAEVELDGLLREWMAWRAYEFPDWARIHGFPTRPDAITSYGSGTEGRRVGQLRAFLGDLDAMEVAALETPSRQDHAAARLLLQQAIDGYECGAYLLPLELSAQGIGGLFLECKAGLSPERAEDCELYHKRLTWIPQRCADILELFREGKRRGILGSRLMFGNGQGTNIKNWLGNALPLDAALSSGEAIADPKQRSELLATLNERTVPQIRAALTELDQYLTDIYGPACADHSTPAVGTPDAQRLYRHLFAQRTGLTEAPEVWLQQAMAELDRLKPAIDAAVARSAEFLAEPDLAGLPVDARRVRYLRWIERTQGRGARIPESEVPAAIEASWSELRPNVVATFGLPLAQRLGCDEPVRRFNPVSPFNTFHVGTVRESTLVHRLADPVRLTRMRDGSPLPERDLENPGWRRRLLRNEMASSFVDGWEAHLRAHELLDGNPADPNPRRLAERARSLVRFIVEIGPATGAWSEDRAAELWSAWSDRPASEMLSLVRASSPRGGLVTTPTAIDLAIRSLRDEMRVAHDPLPDPAFYEALFRFGPLRMSIAERSVREILAKPVTP